MDSGDSFWKDMVNKAVLHDLFNRVPVPLTANRNDPAPGRCRRTDGRKWRCSFSTLPHSHYCERHIKRLRRNRSAANPYCLGPSSAPPPAKEAHPVVESEPSMALQQDPTVNLNQTGAEDPSKLVGPSSDMS